MCSIAGFVFNSSIPTDNLHLSRLLWDDIEVRCRSENVENGFNYNYACTFHHNLTGTMAFIHFQPGDYVVTIEQGIPDFGMLGLAFDGSSQRQVKGIFCKPGEIFAEHECSEVEPNCFHGVLPGEVFDFGIILQEMVDLDPGCQTLTEPIDPSASILENVLVVAVISAFLVLISIVVGINVHRRKMKESLPLEHIAISCPTLKPGKPIDKQCVSFSTEVTNPDSEFGLSPNDRLASGLEAFSGQPSINAQQIVRTQDKEVPISTDVIELATKVTIITLEKACIMDHDVEQNYAKNDLTTTFELYEEPDITLQDYLIRIVKGISEEFDESTGKEAAIRSLIISFMYMESLVVEGTFTPTLKNLHQMFALLLLMSVKFVEDEEVSMTWWSKLSGIDLKSLLELEIQLFVKSKLDFIDNDPIEFERMLNSFGFEIVSDVESSIASFN